MRRGGPSGGNDRLYLIDPFNFTGFAQVISEVIPDATPGACGEPTAHTPVRNYIIGDDVLSQVPSGAGGAGPVADHFLYDGHGSTRDLDDRALDGWITHRWCFPRCIDANLYRLRLFPL